MISIRQKALRLFYPLLMKAGHWSGKHNDILQNNEGKLFQTPIYDRTVVLNHGTEKPLHSWQGKVEVHMGSLESFSLHRTPNTNANQEMVSCKHPKFCHC